MWLSVFLCSCFFSFKVQTRVLKPACRNGSQDLTSEEHLGLTRRTIKRTLSNSSITSVHRALNSSGGTKEQANKGDIETLTYMFGGDSGGVGC